MPELSAAGDGPAGRHRAATRQQHAADRTPAPAHALLQARVPAPSWPWGWGSALELGRGVCRRVLHQGSSLHGISLGSGVGVGEPQVLLGSSEMLVEGTWPYREPMFWGGRLGLSPPPGTALGPSTALGCSQNRANLESSSHVPIGLVPPQPELHPAQPQVGSEPPEPFYCPWGPSLLPVRSDSCRPSAAARAASPLPWVFSPGISHRRLSSQPCQRSLPRTRAQPQLLLRYHEVTSSLGQDGDRDTGWALLPSSPCIALILL